LGKVYGQPGWAEFTLTGISEGTSGGDGLTEAAGEGGALWWEF